MNEKEGPSEEGLHGPGQVGMIILNIGNENNQYFTQPGSSSESVGNWGNGSAPQGSSRCARTC